eukprot:1160080-Pelagomonas_calceolata.AAC.14
MPAWAGIAAYKGTQPDQSSYKGTQPDQSCLLAQAVEIMHGNASPGWEVPWEAPPQPHRATQVDAVLHLLLHARHWTQLQPSPLSLKYYAMFPWQPSHAQRVCQSLERGSLSEPRPL